MRTVHKYPLSLRLRALDGSVYLEVVEVNQKLMIPVEKLGPSFIEDYQKTVEEAREQKRKDHEVYLQLTGRRADFLGES